VPILILLLYIILNPMCSDDVKKQRLWLLCTCRFYFAVIHLQFFDVRYTLQEPLQCRIWECTSSNTLRGSAQYEYRMFEISLGWKCKSSGMKCHVDGWVVASVAKDHCLHLQGHNWSNLSEGTMILWNFGGCSPSDTSGVPRNFVWGGLTNSVEDRENGDLGAVDP